MQTDLDKVIEHASSEVETAFRQEFVALEELRNKCVAFVKSTLDCKAGERGQQNDSITSRFRLLAGLIQGLPATERLIVSGQYIKAAAALKQDYESIARINEVLQGTARKAATPNVKFAPLGSQRFYGELNKVAHPSNEHILHLLVTAEQHGTGISPLPKYHRAPAHNLYQLHIWLLLEASFHSMKLLIDVFGDKDQKLQGLIEELMTLSEGAKKVGLFQFVKADETG